MCFWGWERGRWKEREREMERQREKELDRWCMDETEENEEGKTDR